MSFFCWMRRVFRRCVAKSGDEAQRMQRIESSERVAVAQSAELLRAIEYNEHIGQLLRGLLAAAQVEGEVKKHGDEEQ